jgi:hypothetical protein
MESRRTPQLMSKPTPPGEITPPVLRIEGRRRPPIGKP